MVGVEHKNASLRQNSSLGERRKERRRRMRSRRKRRMRRRRKRRMRRRRRMAGSLETLTRDAKGERKEMMTRDGHFVLQKSRPWARSVLETSSKERWCLMKRDKRWSFELLSRMIVASGR
jgi:hypothetical protein